MSSRDEVLKRVRRHLLPAVERPDLVRDDWQRFPDPLGHFRETLKSVGGDSVVVPDLAAADAELGKLASYAEATKVVSLVPEVGRATVDVDAVTRPHDLADVEFAVLPGRFGVAENAAVWLDLRAAKHRVICVLSQHLAVVLPAAEIVNTMHEAYARLIGPAAEQEFTRPGFGLFLSGPSKTADIEQSLVIGAHGARSLTVLLVQR